MPRGRDNVKPTIETLAGLAPLLVAVSLLTACNPGAGDSGAARSVATHAAAVADSARPDADREHDRSRKPAEVLEFLGIAPGMDVLDLFSGGGYYTEIVSRVVAPDGTVVAHTNEAYIDFSGEEFANRYAGDRLANVSILIAENNELDLEPDSFDAILMMLTFHDLYYSAPQNGWPKIHVEPLLAELYDSLKPGGIVGIVDHYAEAGAPREIGGTLHRIDPRVVISDMESAGFRLDAKSDLLRNMSDDYSKPVFDPSVRGKTDRFLMRFVKPG